MTRTRSSTPTRPCACTATSARATGPDTLVVREVGGTVDGYTQEAIGFPAIRSGEDVVLLLAQWEDSADYRIHAFNQGKFLVRNRGGVEVLIDDPVKQGEARLTGRDGRIARAGRRRRRPGPHHRRVRADGRRRARRRTKSTFRSATKEEDKP